MEARCVCVGGVSGQDAGRSRPAERVNENLSDPPAIHSKAHSMDELAAFTGPRTSSPPLPASGPLARSGIRASSQISPAKRGGQRRRPTTTLRDDTPMETGIRTSQHHTTLTRGTRG